MQPTAAPSFQPIKAPGTALPGAPLLDPSGPKAVLGWTPDALAAPLKPAPEALFGPRGVCLHPNGSLWVCDTGHHRILGWNDVPESDNAPADILIGQSDFAAEGRNGKGTPSLATVNVPTGICAWGQGLAVADAWNHRVLLWRNLPTSNNQPADIVLGQEEASAIQSNRGAEQPTAATLHWPYGVQVIEGELVVADTGNRRVLVWRVPKVSGQPADLVLGQTDFETRDENGGRDVDASGMRWPHGIAWWQGHLAVADAGNNRIMLWQGFPATNGAAAATVLGQDDFKGCDHNKAAYYPSSSALNMPYDVAVAGDRLLVADTASSRMIGWAEPSNPDADRLTGQPDFASKGDNGWGLPGRDTLCWPYGLSVLDGLAAVADSGNNRVLLWEIMP